MTQFELNSAPSTFQCVIKIVFSGLNLITCLFYLDDVIIHSKDVNQNFWPLGGSFISISTAQSVRVKISKYTFAAPNVSCLCGHVISAEGISPDSTKVEAVQDLLSPKSVKDVKSFHWLAGYFRGFVSDLRSSSAYWPNQTRQTVSLDRRVPAGLSDVEKSYQFGTVLKYPRFDRGFIV